MQPSECSAIPLPIKYNVNFPIASLSPKQENPSQVYTVGYVLRSKLSIIGPFPYYWLWLILFSELASDKSERNGDN